MSGLIQGGNGEFSDTHDAKKFMDKPKSYLEYKKFTKIFPKTQTFAMRKGYTAKGVIC